MKRRSFLGGILGAAASALFPWWCRPSNVSSPASAIPVTPPMRDKVSGPVVGHVTEVRDGGEYWVELYPRTWGNAYLPRCNMKFNSRVGDEDMREGDLLWVDEEGNFVNTDPDGTRYFLVDIAREGGETGNGCRYISK